MKPYSANVWETLVEALHVYWQTIKEKWAALLAVIIPIQLVMALYRFAVASSGAAKVSSLRFEHFVASALGLTIGLLPVAIVIDHAFFKCTGQHRPAGGGIAAAWGRMMATGWLRAIAEIAIAVVVVVISSVVLALALAAPLAQLGGAAAVLVCAVAFIVLAPLVAVIVWIAVRWGFAVVLSALHPVMGSTALGESWHFVRARAGRCILLLIAAWLVTMGISAIPDSLATWYARGEMAGLPAPSGTVLTRTVAQFLVGLFTSFGGLFMPVAMTTFWVRTLEPYDLSESLRRSGVRLLIPVLLVLGVLTYAFAGVFSVKAITRERAEKAQERAEMLKLRAFGSLREESVAVHSLPDAYKEEHMRMEDGELVVDSPFDLCIGSSEAAKLLGAKLHSSTYDGTKQHYFASARLSKPYFGCQTLSLNFYGEEKSLGSIHLNSRKLPLDDCRKTVLDIAADISQRFGVKMEQGTDETAEGALKRHKRWLSSADNSRYQISFIERRTRMDNGQKTVSYEVEGMVDSQTKELSAELSIRAEDK